MTTKYIRGLFFVPRLNFVDIAETNDWERWYVGMDVSFSGRMMVAGNNKGYVTLLSLEGEKIWDLKLHNTTVVRKFINLYLPLTSLISVQTENGTFK